MRALQVLTATLLLLCFANAQTGESYCNAGFCSATDLCDLGVCCTVNNTLPTGAENGTCVNALDVPVIPSGGACDVLNPCERCMDGEFCIEGNCTVPEPPGPQPCATLDYGCACTDNANCTSGYCATDGTCRSTNLKENDACIDDDQCLSGNCNNVTGRCVGIELGGACTPGLNNPCTYGTYCAALECVEGSALGESCESSLACYEFGTTCVNNTCINQQTQGEGEECAVDSDCQFGLQCNETNQCQAPGLCNAGSCPTTHTCECDGTTGTHCAPIQNFCLAEAAAFVTCMRTTNCTNIDQAALYWTEEPCAYQCLDQAIALTCCTSCGGAANNIINSPTYFLDCGASSYNYQPTCNVCHPDYPRSACAAPTTPDTDNTDNTDTDAPVDGEDGTDSEDSGAATLIPVLAALMTMLYSLF